MKIQVTLALYNECKKHNLSDSEIAKKLGITAKELGEKKKTWKFQAPRYDITPEKYLAHRKRGMTNIRIAKKYKMSEVTLYRKRKEWEFLGFLDNEPPLAKKEVQKSEFLELKRSRDALAVELELDAKRIESLEKQNQRLKEENERLNARINKEMEKSSKAKELEQEFETLVKLYNECKAKIAEKNTGKTKEYENAIKQAIKAVDFYGKSDFKFAAKAGLEEIKGILGGVYQSRPRL